MSDTWMASICGCTSLPCAGCVGLHPDFGSYGSTVYGIPFVDVVAGQSTVPVDILEYPTESDYPGPFPIPASAPIEGLTAATRTCPLAQCFGDRHVLVRDTSSCMLYELYHAEVVNEGVSWNAGSTAVFNLTSNARRPLGWTSADASGNSIYAGLVKQAEVASGEIKHAIRMTLPVTQKAYINELASHYAAYSSDPTLPPMGLRLRLKPSFDCSALQQSARVVCVALQKYGAVIMDNGSKGYLTGEANPAFNSAELADIHQIPLSAMEAVLSGPLCTTADCSQPNVVSQVSISAIAAADFPSVHMSGNVWHFDKYAYEAAQSLSFVNRDPANFVYGSLSAWQSAALALGSPVDTSVEADPGLDAWLNPASALIQSLQPVLQAVPGVSDDYYGTARSSVPAIVPGAIAVTPATVLNSGVSPAGWPALSLLLAPTAQCPGAPLTFASLYVDAIGGDDSSCTPDVVATPLRSLAAALRLIAPSGTITLRAGTHATAGVVVSVPSITITSYAGETAVLRAPVSINRGSPLMLTGSASGVTLSGLEIRGGFDSGLVIDGPAGVQVLGCTIHGSGGVAVDIRNSAGTVVDSCTVRSSGQMNAPDGHGITLTNSPAAQLHANYIDSTRAFGIVIDYGSQSSVVSRNQIVNCGGGVSVGPVRQPDLDTNAVVCASSAAKPICYRVSGALIANNLILSTRGSGLHLAGTTGVQAVHNTLVRCGLAMGAGVELAALQLWDATTSAGQIVSNDATLLQNNIVVTAPLSALPVLSISSQQPWAGGTSVPGVQWATATLSNNLFYKDPTIEAANYTNLFYSLNAKTGALANSGYGSLSVGSNVPYVLDTGLPWPYRYSVQSWNTQRSAANAVGSPGFSLEYIPSSALAAAGSAVASACSLVDEAVDLLGRARICASASVGALESVAAVATPVYASVGLAQPGPGSCMAPANDAAACSPPNCYHAWQSTPAPAGLDNAAIYSKCLANGAMFSGAGSEWSRDVSALPVHPLSDSYVASIGLGKGIHPDFGSQYGGDMMGIPTVVVNSAFPRTPVSFLYNTESDNVGYPIPTAPMEGGECSSNGDRHMLVLEKDTCTIYELYQLYRYDPAYWSSVGVSAWAQAGAVFSTSSNGMRPNTQGWTSADAAGLSVYAGLVHWYEVYGLGAINHAIRMTIAHPQRAYVSPPATHLVGSATDTGLPAMGQRFRLKQSYDCIANLVSVEARIVCAAMKKYGTIVADIGSDWYISGEAHPGWVDANVNEIKSIQSNFFEAVVTGGQTCTDAGCV